MNNLFSTGALVVVSLFSFASCSTQEEAPKPAPTAAPVAAPAQAKAEKAPAKAKATKLAGDVGLLDLEKNYMILVTKEGKLVTLDFDAKVQPVKRSLAPGKKVADIGLGSAATVTYTKQGEKNLATSIEYLPAKGE